MSAKDFLQHILPNGEPIGITYLFRRVLALQMVIRLFFGRRTVSSFANTGPNRSEDFTPYDNIPYMVTIRILNKYK